jgi:hypothetical protein
MSYSRRNSIAMEYDNRLYWHLFLVAFFIATIFQPGAEGRRGKRSLHNIVEP